MDFSSDTTSLSNRVRVGIGATATHSAEGASCYSPGSASLRAQPWVGSPHRSLALKGRSLAPFAAVIMPPFQGLAPVFHVIQGFNVGYNIAGLSALCASLAQSQRPMAYPSKTTAATALASVVSDFRRRAKARAKPWSAGTCSSRHSSDLSRRASLASPEPLPRLFCVTSPATHGWNEFQQSTASLEFSGAPLSWSDPAKHRRCANFAKLYD